MRRRQLLAVREAAEQALQMGQGRQARTSAPSAPALPQRQSGPQLRVMAGVSRSIWRCAERLPEPHQSEFLALHKEADRLLAAGWSLHKSAWALYRRETGWLK